MEFKFTNPFSLDETITPSGGKTSNLTVKDPSANVVLYKCTASNKAGTSDKFTSYITVIRKGLYTHITLAKSFDHTKTKVANLTMDREVGQALGFSFLELMSLTIFQVIRPLPIMK